jgi:murein DD-endopeptidase MepM/ murein hydrolase activator NlpD
VFSLLSFKRAFGLSMLVAVPFLPAITVAGGAPRAAGRVQATAPVLLPRDDLRRDAGGFIRRERARYERRLMRSGVVPVRGPVDYGTETNGFGAGRGGHVHNGQDMFGPSGTPLVAARDGVVLEAGSDGGRGNYLVLYSRAARQTYAYFHMLAPSRRKPGRHVRAGRRVGALGCSGSCDGAHLHFEVHRGRGVTGRGIDPKPFLRRWHKLPRG